MAVPFARDGWAKTVELADGTECVYALIDHLLDTAAVALLLWDRYLAANQRAVICSGLGRVDGERARRLVAFWAGLHDIGKLTPSFQRCDEQGWRSLAPNLRADAGRAAKVYHDVAGLRSVPKVLSGLGYDFGEEGVYDGSAGWAVAQMIGGHHGLFHTADLDTECVGAHTFDGFGGTSWDEARVAHAAVVHEVLGSPAPPGRVEPATAVLITGIIILADWLVSQEHFLQAQVVSGIHDPAQHFDAVFDVGVRLLAEAGLDASGFAWKPLDFSAHFGIDQPNALQGAALELLPGAIRGPGIFVATMLMGDGKTELALSVQYLMAQAAGCDGFFLALPTMATSDQMYVRARGYTERATTGPAAVSLAHSMAWLNPAYAPDPANAGLPSLDAEAGVSGRTAAVEWLFGSKRPLLARVSTGTIDQALAAVLPMRHNALRLLALSGRTLIVDEAHAYDPYMQVLLERLLTWLGSYGTSVVMLSATLPGSTVDRLVRAYLRGAGWKRSNRRDPARQLPAEPYRLTYPGWVHVDATTAQVVAEPESAVREQHARSRRTELALEVRRVRHAPWDRARTARAGERLAEVEKVLEPLLADGGTAAIVCTTVDQAQETYEYLRHGAFRERPVEELVLLHARYPADERERRTKAIVTALGRTGPRPERLVVVSTSLVEQSLDLDVDLLISDLAPISLLLQRAGRCWRHELYWKAPEHMRPRERPAWCQEGPCLVTLVPVGRDQAFRVPETWGSVYHPYLLTATARLLDELGDTTVVLPDRVQDLVEKVYGAGTRFSQEVAAVDHDGADLSSASRSAWDGEQLAQRQIADCIVIAGPDSVSDLSVLTARDFPETEVGTRLGADSVRVLPCYLHADGTVTLDAEGVAVLPTRPAGDSHRFTRTQIRAVMGRTVPCAERHLNGRSDETNPPASWARQPWLRDLVLVPHRRGADGVWLGTRFGKRTLTLDSDLGLVIRG